jgi:hypothetical protein
MQNQKTNHVITIGGQKGGIGKSFITRGILELLLPEIPIRLCETDPIRQANKLIRYTYPDFSAKKHLQIRAFDIREKTEGIIEGFNTIFENDWIPEGHTSGVTLVDLAAGTDWETLDCKETLQCFEFFQEGQKSHHLHIIVVNTAEDTDKIREITQYTTDPSVEFVVVLNSYPNYKGSPKRKEILEIAEKLNITVLEMPKLFEKTAEWMRTVESPELWQRGDSLTEIKEKGYIPVPLMQIGNNWKHFTSSIDRRNLQAIIQWWRLWKKNKEAIMQMLSEKD